MTNHQNLQALAQDGQVAPPLTREERFTIAGGAFTKRPQRMWATFKNVENTEPHLFRAQSVTGTVFDPVTKALGRAGLPMNGTVGAVMDALDLSQDAVHNAFCECWQGEHMKGAYIKAVFEALAK